MNSSKTDRLVDRIIAFYEEQAGKKHQQKRAIRCRRIIDIAIAYPLDAALIFYMIAAFLTILIAGTLI